MLKNREKNLHCRHDRPAESRVPTSVVNWNVHDISWGSKDNEQECELSAKLVFFFCGKIFTRKMVIPRTWIRKEVVFYS